MPSCAVSDGASNLSPIVQESPLPSTPRDAFHCSTEVPVVPRPEDDCRIESEQDPTDGGFQVGVESISHGRLSPYCFTSLPDDDGFTSHLRRDHFKRQIKDEDGFASHLRRDLFKRQIKDEDGLTSYLRRGRFYVLPQTKPFNVLLRTEGHSERKERDSETKQIEQREQNVGLK
jgi:hypothetical protein